MPTLTPVMNKAKLHTEVRALGTGKDFKAFSDETSCGLYVGLSMVGDFNHDKKTAQSPKLSQGIVTPSIKAPGKRLVLEAKGNHDVLRKIAKACLKKADLKYQVVFKEPGAQEPDPTEEDLRDDDLDTSSSSEQDDEPVLQTSRSEDKVPDVSDTGPSVLSTSSGPPQTPPRPNQGPPQRRPIQPQRGLGALAISSGQLQKQLLGIGKTITALEQDAGPRAQALKLEFQALAGLVNGTEQERASCKQRLDTLQGNAEQLQHQVNGEKQGAVHRQMSTQVEQSLQSPSPYLDNNLAGILDGLADDQRVGSDTRLKLVSQAVRRYQTIAQNPNATFKDLHDAVHALDVLANKYKDVCEQEFGGKLEKEGTHRHKKYQANEVVRKQVEDAKKNLADVQTDVAKLREDVKQQLRAYTGGQTDAINIKSVEALEKLAKNPRLPDDQQTPIQGLAHGARTELIKITNARLQNLQNPSGEQKAQVLLECLGGCKPPSSDIKGTSDSFILYGTDGKPSYFYKPHDGEQRAGVDWPEGGGAPREILLSKLNDQLATDIGLTCGVPKTELAQLTDDAFRSGTISQNPHRVGALVQAIGLQPGDPKNAVDWLRGKNNTEITALMAKLNKKDCQAGMVMNFITMDVDANPGNVMITNANGGPGQARLAMIDAGRKLPTKEMFKRGPYSMSLETPPVPGQFTDTRNFLLQTPSALEPFDDETIAKIDQMDADKIVQDMQTNYANLAQQAPELNNTVDPSSFEMVKKSILFLKEAVHQQPPLTPYDIAEIYALGFGPIVDAGPQDLQRAIQDTLRAYQDVKARGGDAAVKQRGIEPKHSNEDWLTIQQKARILAGQPPINNKAEFEQYHYRQLQQELGDIRTFLDGPEKITDELTRPFAPENYKYLKNLAYYKKEGGDPMLRKMIDCDESYRVEVAKPLDTRSGNWVWGYAKRYYGLGGTPELIKRVGKEKFDRDLRGQEVGTMNDALEQERAKAKT